MLPERLLGREARLHPRLDQRLLQRLLQRLGRLALLQRMLPVEGAGESCPKPARPQRRARPHTLAKRRSGRGHSRPWEARGPRK